MLSLATFHTRTHGLRRPLAWLLVVALLIYGHAATMAQVLGHEHRHVEHDEVSWLHTLQARWVDAFSDLRAWRAELRGQWTPQAHGPHVHADGRSHSHADAAPDEHAHTHRHDTAQRHHHAAGDPSVVIEAGSPDASSPDVAPAAAVAGVTLSPSLAARWVLPERTAADVGWPPVSAHAWDDTTLPRLERPPRG